MPRSSKRCFHRRTAKQLRQGGVQFRDDIFRRPPWAPKVHTRAKQKKPAARPRPRSEYSARKPAASWPVIANGLRLPAATSDLKVATNGSINQIRYVPPADPASQDHCRDTARIEIWFRFPSETKFQRVARFAPTPAMPTGRLVGVGLQPGDQSLQIVRRQAVPCRRSKAVSLPIRMIGSRSFNRSNGRA